MPSVEHKRLDGGAAAGDRIDVVVGGIDVTIQDVEQVPDDGVTVPTEDEARDSFPLPRLLPLTAFAYPSGAAAGAAYATFP